MGMAFLESRREGETLELDLRGCWRAPAIGAIRQEFGAISLDGVREVRITQAGVERLDMAGAWVLEDLTRMLAVQGIGVMFTDEKLGALMLVRSALYSTGEERPAAMRGDVNFSIVERLGRTTVERVQGVRDGLDFVGQNTMALLRVLGNWRRMRPISVARHVYDTGITAIPVVSLIAFLISVIVAYMAASQLRNYGADIYVVDLITVGVLRELGVLLTAIIVAGRTGSSFAAELGSMRLNEEVDALDATGVDPIESLVLPRILGLMISLPLLTVIADLVGIVGGATLCIWLLDMPVEQFISRASEAIGPTTFWAGLVKAPVFAVLIALAGTYRGLQVRGSARELGRLTTVAVVQSIFLVLLADALFAMVFLELDF
jgi:phospholipid/cholesterol/gamma-HCH transport system permease protein